MRTHQRLAAVASASVLAFGLAACGTTSLNQPGYGSYPATTSYPTTTQYPGGAYPGAGQVAGVEFGRITNIEYVQGQGTAGGGTSETVGTVAGGVVGAALGNQVGGGSGRTAATILGALGGAYAGNRIGKNRDGSTYTGPAYRVTVQTDQGQWRTYEVSATGDLRVGDRVRVENGVIYRS
jgi:outer membrane lipoprotein SlyB